MALGDPYITLTELKTYVKATTNADDEVLSNALASASVEVERICKRQFQQDSTASEREYDAERISYRTRRKKYRVEVDDFYTTDSLVVVVDDITLTSDQYTLFPRGGVVDGQTGWPFTAIESDLLTSESEVSVTAKWGWAAVPSPVKQAAFILAGETYKLKDALLGVAGVDDWGFVHVRDNKAANAKLARYRRRSVLVKLCRHCPKSARPCGTP